MLKAVNAGSVVPISVSKIVFLGLPAGEIESVQNSLAFQDPLPFPMDSS
jgi:hypothetical protein